MTKLFAKNRLLMPVRAKLHAILLQTNSNLRLAMLLQQNLRTKSLELIKDFQMPARCATVSISPSPSEKM